MEHPHPNTLSVSPNALQQAKHPSGTKPPEEQIPHSLEHPTPAHALAEVRDVVACFASPALPRLLGLVLAAGNYLNGGTGRGQADGCARSCIAANFARCRRKR